MAGVVVLDANVLIALYEGNDAHHAWAVNTIADTAADDLVISVVTYAEAMVRPMRLGTNSQFTAGLEQLNVGVLPLPAVSAEHVARVRATTNLRMPDAVVLQAALEHGGAIATADASLAAAAISHGVAVYRP